jgi:hypothetical protein
VEESEEVQSKLLVKLDHLDIPNRRSVDAEEREKHQEALVVESFDCKVEEHIVQAVVR